jgi:hypothetical protein
VAVVVLLTMVVGLLFAAPAGAVPPPPDEPKCATIQGGSITDALGTPLSTGYDEFGYNYQAHLFNGPYDGYDRVWGNDTSSYADDLLIMKWSDTWLANVDCDFNGKLDRGLIGNVVGGISLGWLTNHLEGDYDSDADGIEDAHYVDFVKIVWTGPGSPLWEQYTIIEEVYNDPVAGMAGLLVKVGVPGFGVNDGWTTLPLP